MAAKRGRPPKQKPTSAGAVTPGEETAATDRRLRRLEEEAEARRAAQAGEDEDEDEDEDDDTPPADEDEEEEDAMGHLWESA